MTVTTAADTLSRRLAATLYEATTLTDAQRIASDLVFSADAGADLSIPYLLRLMRANRLATRALDESLATRCSFHVALDHALNR